MATHIDCPETGKKLDGRQGAPESPRRDPDGHHAVPTLPPHNTSPTQPTGSLPIAPYTLNDIRDLLRYRRAMAAHRATMRTTHPWKLLPLKFMAVTRVGAVDLNSTLR